MLRWGIINTQLAAASNLHELIDNRSQNVHSPSSGMTRSPKVHLLFLAQKVCSCVALFNKNVVFQCGNGNRLLPVQNTSFSSTAFLISHDDPAAQQLKFIYLKKYDNYFGQHLF